MGAKIAILVLKMLTGVVGQDKVWEAVNALIDRRTKIKLEVRNEEKELRKTKINKKKYKQGGKLIDAYIKLHEKAFKEGVTITPDQEVALVVMENQIINEGSDSVAEIVRVRKYRRNKKLNKT